jgi:DUF1680 family protein
MTTSNTLVQSARRLALVALAATLVCGSAAARPRRQAQASAAPADYSVRPVPFTAVHVNDSFWAPRNETNRTVTIPYAFGKDEETGRVRNFEQAAATLAGRPVADRQIPGYPFDDTDVYKVIEGAAYGLSVHPDPKLEAYVDGLVEKIRAAQEPDGYIYTARTIDPAHPHAWSGSERWVKEEDLSHELYDLGHLYEAAVAYYQATGKRALLDIAIKSADLLDSTFGPGKRTVWPGHQIVEMGLVKLYRTTGDERYLRLAKFFLDARGPGGTANSQANERVVDQTEAVGHAVRATYMYSGMADVAALTGDAAYVRAIDRIWEDVARSKLYVTGGIGARADGEAFGAAYELPNLSAYSETCAAVGNVYWNQRLFLLHADAKYVDVLERTLYNGLISGVSLDGKSFFYPNPLESNGQHQRSPWFGCACCPGNITRFMASVPGYVYAQRGDTLFVNLFVGNTADVVLDDGTKVKIAQQTRYPWDGAVAIRLDPERAGRFTVKVRIPGWARGEASPGGLYRFVDRADAPATLKVNGRPVPIELDHGYATIAREWKPGDTIDLELPMPVRRVAAADAVAADRGRTALQRGPIVYCAEWPDNPGGRVRNLVLSADAKLAAEFRPQLLGGVEVLTGTATSLAYDDAGKIATKQQPFTAIPYYAWANRGPGEMIVWIAENQAVARALPRPTIASTSRVTTSSGEGAAAINDQEEPHSSNDRSSGWFHWWPHKGTTEWAEYTFAKPSTVSEVAVYWYDDTGTGECRVPASWRVLYKTDDGWKPVATDATYGVERDRFNRITFAAVTTTALRLEVTLQPEWSGGIIEWATR